MKLASAPSGFSGSFYLPDFAILSEFISLPSDEMSPTIMHHELLVIFAMFAPIAGAAGAFELIPAYLNGLALTIFTKLAA